MSLATPPKLRRLQDALYTKARQEPAYRFYLLYDKVYRADILAHAYALSRQHGGAPGVDGVTFEAIEAEGRERWLAVVQEALRTQTYQPQAVRRVRIPKPGGGERPLGIPTVRDRVVQTAALLILQAIFEADLDPAAYGYRPGRSALEAVQEVHRALCAGHTEVVDADVSQYLDAIPHAELVKSLARRLSDRRMLWLLKRWLKAPVAEPAAGRGWRYSGGKRATRGTPQGGVISPLLANLYMNRYLKVFRLRGLDRRYGARLVDYADDFVVLCRYGAAEVLAQSRRWFAQMGLTLNEQKTRVCDGRRESFSFLGYTFGPMHYRKDGHWYPGGRAGREGGEADQGTHPADSPTDKPGAVGRGRGGTRSRAARVGPLLLVRNTNHGVSGGGSLRLGTDTALPAAAAQGPLARDEALLCRRRLRRAGGVSAQALSS